MTHRKGFSAIELMATLAILTILAAAALPAFSATIERLRLRTATHDLVGALALARSEAVHRGRRTVIWNEHGDWSRGWLLLVDANDNGQWEASDPVLRRWPGYGAGIRIAGNAHLSSYVSYLPSGQARLASNAMQIGSLCVSGAGGGQPGHRIVLSIGGRVRIEPLAPDARC